MGEESPLPEDVVAEAERLTRLAREATDSNEAAAYRATRDELLSASDYEARVREEDDVLVLHPTEWLEDGTILVERVEDVDRGIEVPLSGPGESEAWEAVEAHNRALADAVAEAQGDPHGATAHALADFASNHYAKPIDDLTAGELADFREEYFARNAWPTDAQRAALTTSLRLVYDAAEAPVPGERRD